MTYKKLQLYFLGKSCNIKNQDRDANSLGIKRFKSLEKELEPLCSELYKYNNNNKNNKNKNKKKHCTVKPAGKQAIEFIKSNITSNLCSSVIRKYKQCTTKESSEGMYLTNIVHNLCDFIFDKVYR